MKHILLSLILAITSTAYAHDNWVSSSGQVVKSGTGLCWRSGAWTPATAAPECDGALKPPVKVAEVSKPSQVNVTKPTATIAQAAATPPIVVKATYSTDALFDFDKSVIKPAGKQALDGILHKIDGITLEVVIVVGHTDSVGTDAYNMKLGHRRANAVKAYLVSKGIPAHRIYTESKGEKQPVADNKTADGRAKNRRVEVEVVGNK